MSAVALSLRPLARRQHQLIRTTFRRYATETPSSQQAANTAKATAESAAAKAQETAANVASKAQELFNKGIAAAGPMASKLSESTLNAVNNAPGGGNKVVGAVQGMIPHVVYYSKVVAELGKHIYRGQGMSPPSLESVAKFYNPFTSALLNPSSWWGHAKTIRPRIAALPDPETALQRLQSVPSKELAQYAVWAAECIGFFTVGTMIGRRKIVGYRGGAQAHH